MQLTQRRAEPSSPSSRHPLLGERTNPCAARDTQPSSHLHASRVDCQRPRHQSTIIHGLPPNLDPTPSLGIRYGAVPVAERHGPQHCRFPGRASIRAGAEHTTGSDDEQQPSPRLDVMLALNAKQQPADDSSAATGDRVAIAHASPRMPGFSRLCHPVVMGVHAVAMPHLGARRRAERSPDPAAAINVQLGQFCARIGW